MNIESSMRPSRSLNKHKSLKAGMFLAMILLLLLSTSTAMANQTLAQRAVREAAGGKIAPTVTIGVAAWLNKD